MTIWERFCLWRSRHLSKRKSAVEAMGIDEADFESLAKKSAKSRFRARATLARTRCKMEACDTWHWRGSPFVLALFGTSWLGTALYLCLEKGMPILLSPIVQVAIGAGLLIWLWAWIGAEHDSVFHHIYISDRELSISKRSTYLPLYLRIALEKQRLAAVGPFSEIQIVKREIIRKRETAQKLIEQISARIGVRKYHKNPSDFLKDAGLQLLEASNRLREQVEKLDRFIATTNEFFDTCRDQIGAIERPLSDLELLQEAQALTDSIEDVEETVISTIECSLAELKSGLNNTLALHSNVFENAGIHLAAAQPDLELIERTVDAHVPAEDRMTA